MDPTLAPNFVPPSEQKKSQLTKSALSNLIPNVSPIQPYVLEDFNSELDAPTSRRNSSTALDKHLHHHHHHHHFPTIHRPILSQMSAEAVATTDYSGATSEEESFQPQPQHPASSSTFSLPSPLVETTELRTSLQEISLMHSKYLSPAPTNIPRIPTELTNDSSSSSISSTSSSPVTAHQQLEILSSTEDISTSTSNTTTQPNTTRTHSSTKANQSLPNSQGVSPNVSSGGAGRPVVHSADLEEVPIGVSRQAQTLQEYKFPTHRLTEVMVDESKSPLVIVACGSFSPITYLHLRMFEMAMDSIREQTRFEVIGGYYSPVSDNYKKPGLASSKHRVRMCELACERTSSWLMVDAWESLQSEYQRTALVLDHLNHEVNVVRKGVATASGRRKGVKIMLLAGGDLIESMGEPNVWAEDDLHHILGKYGCLIVERTGSDVRSFLLSHDIMYEHRRNVLVIKQLIYNDISSTKVRLFIRRGMSVQYLLPNSVIRYIEEHGLYNESEPVKQVLSERGD